MIKTLASIGARFRVAVADLVLVISSTPPYERHAKQGAIRQSPLRRSGDEAIAGSTSRLHVCVGVVCLVIGFIGILLGGRDAVGQTLLIAGSIFVLTSLFAFRGFRFGAQRDREERDMRKLYGTPKV